MTENGEAGRRILPPKLSFGYLYDFRNPPQWQRPWADLYAEILDFIAWSETVGFEGAWVPEHHGAEDGYMPSPLVALALQYRQHELCCHALHHHSRTPDGLSGVTTKCCQGGSFASQ